MTRTEAYDLACKKWKEPAAVEMGGRCLLGEWVALGEVSEADEATEQFVRLSQEFTIILRSKNRGVFVRGEGATWGEAMKAAKLDEEQSPLGCDQINMPSDSFCPRCFGIILRSKNRGVFVRGEGATLDEAIKAAKLDEAQSPRVVAAESIFTCKTLGCEQINMPSDSFCPRCFEEPRKDF